MTVIDQIKQAFGSSSSSHTDTTTASTTTAPHTTSDSTSHSQTQPIQGNTSTSTSTASVSAPNLPDKEVFDRSKVTVIFVLGGPGAGKGTQSENLVRDYGFKHLSAGDLLRAEQQRPGSTYGAMIKEYITEGKIVPMEVTVKLLENAMREALSSPPTFSNNAKLSSGWENGKGRFLIDGFPRKMDQAIKFDESVCQSSFVLFFKTTEQVLLARLLERGKTSGRDDDNVESIKKRFRTFEETSMPVVDYYRAKGKVVEIDSTPPIEVVYDHVRVAIDERLALIHPAGAHSHQEATGLTHGATSTTTGPAAQAGTGPTAGTGAAAGDVSGAGATMFSEEAAGSNQHVGIPLGKPVA